MSFEYVDFNEAKNNQGLRLVVVQGIPSPWSEAAKGVLHVKSIPFSAVYFDPFKKDMPPWSGSASAPSAVYNDEAPVSDWKAILTLAERLKPTPSLVPAEQNVRDKMMEISATICGKGGLAWYRRLEGVHKGLTGEAGGFPDMAAKYLAQKYGYEKDKGLEYGARTNEILHSLAAQLKEQKSKGSHYYIGNSLTAADIYSATVMACFKPLPQEQCAMLSYIRPVFEALDPAMKTALDPILIEHRDAIYQDYLSLPLSL